MSTPIKDKLTQLKQHASITELDVKAAHFRATRLAEAAQRVRATADLADSEARKAFDKIGELSDRAEAALEAFEVYRESVTGIN